MEIRRPGARPGEDDEMTARLGELGEYHRISPYALWGLDDRPRDCPFCAAPMANVMTIDTDENLLLKRRSRPTARFSSSTRCGDIDYLGVSRCSGCQAFGYRHLHWSTPHLAESMELTIVRRVKRYFIHAKSAFEGVQGYPGGPAEHAGHRR